MLAVQPGQVVGEVGRLALVEKLLHEDVWPVVVRRVDELVGDLELHGRRLEDHLQVTAPPVVVVHPLQNDEPLGVNVQDGVGAPGIGGGRRGGAGGGGEEEGKGSELGGEWLKLREFQSTV